MTPEAAYQTWGPEDVNRLIQSHLSMIDFWVDRLRTQVPGYLSRDEMVSAARLGLVDAAHRFNPAKGVLFKTFAEQRIRGAVLDEVRRMDWASRSGREKYSRLCETVNRLQNELGRHPSEEEIARGLGVSLDQYHKLLTEVSHLSLISLEETMSVSEEGQSLYDKLEDPDSENPHQVFEENELANILAEQIQNLSEKERLVVSLYYYEECTQKEIAEILDITEGRVSQIHSQALIRLKVKLQNIFKASRK